ncbi:uncharacterized protein C17orf80 homolog [Mugil cephalus]|uniref:uncharacterized protein C17orf80 homolog n=1 Tax=Mugil cephalus TaxID=48193 RepID=UPI001FB5F1C6|nr:uncharacterized protein C17orf80 homolog [Mugil cephalus]
MGSEVCPFCGKTYKRLKSHLPHCKAAASSKTPPESRHELTTSQTTSSPALTAVAKKAAKAKKSTQTSPVTVGKKASTQTSQTPAKASSSPKSLPPLTKKNQKLTDQTETSSPLSAAAFKPKKKSLRALIEAAKLENMTEGLREGTRSASKTTALTETEANPKKDSVSAEVKPKDAAKKTKQTKPNGHFLSKDKNISEFLDSKAKEVCSGPLKQVKLSVDSQEEMDLSMNRLFLKPGSHRGRITLQNVKSMLGRPNASRQPSRPSILHQIEATNIHSGKIRPDPGPLPPPVDAISRSVTPLDQQLLVTSSRHTEIQSFKKQPAALISLQHDSSPQAEPTSPAAPALSSHTSPPPRALGPSEGLNLFAVSPPLIQFPSPFYFPPQTPSVRPEGDETRKQNTAAHATEGALMHRPLGQVRLRELPEWLAGKTPGHPRGAVEMVQKGWQWYYRRYIDVKKGGVGGLGMLLAGYCVLSYIWSYPHIKLDRWRKYH